MWKERWRFTIYFWFDYLSFHLIFFAFIIIAPLVVLNKKLCVKEITHNAIKIQFGSFWMIFTVIILEEPTSCHTQCKPFTYEDQLYVCSNFKCCLIIAVSLWVLQKWNTKILWILGLSDWYFGELWMYINIYPISIFCEILQINNINSGLSWLKFGM